MIIPILLTSFSSAVCGELCAEIKSEERMSITQYVMVDGEKMSTEDWLVNGNSFSKTQPELDLTCSDMVKVVETHDHASKETTVTLDIYPGTKMVTVIWASAKVWKHRLQRPTHWV